MRVERRAANRWNSRLEHDTKPWWMRKTRRGTMPVMVWLRLRWMNRNRMMADTDGDMWGDY